MQKVLDFLEKNVQWVALGLGGLFLLYIVYAYLLLAPVSTSLHTRGGEQTATLGDIDQYTLDGPAHDLQKAMDNHQPIQIQVTDFSQQFVGAMSWAHSGIQPFDPKMAWVNSQTAPIKLKAVDGTDGGEQQNAGATLPAAPAAPAVAGVSMGRSEIPPKEGAQPAAPSASGKPQGVDKLWASAGFKIPTAQIAQAFKAAKIPEAQAQTLVLRIEAVRQEQLEDGTWGKEMPVKGLAFEKMMPFPKAGDRGGEPEYRQWAASNQGLVLQPPFYQVIGGDVWYVPGTTPPPPPPPPPFDPSRVKPEDIGKLTPEQRKAYNQWRLDQRQKEMEQKRPQRPQRSQRPARRSRTAAPGGGGPPPIGPGYAPSTLDTVGPLAQVDRRRQYSQVTVPPGADPGMPGAPGDVPPDMIPGNTPAAGYQPPNMAADPQWVAEQKKAAGVIPAGQFDPAKTAEIMAWVHDENVQPDHVYRYKARYRILNPLYHAANVAKDRKDTEVFSLESAFSDWSDAVTIPPVTAFFVDGGFYNNTARFEVFHWQDGVWHGKSFIVSPGDVIGQKDDQGIDYATGWSLVAISDSASSNPYAIVTEDGSLRRREVRADRSDPLFTKLRQEAAQAAPPAAGAPGGTAAMPRYP
jgi:hypothetical protein